MMSQKLNSNCHRFFRYTMPEFVKIKITRNISCAEYQGYDDVEIFHPTNASSDATLIIEVLKDGELQGVIPCNKDLMIGNIPVIAAKFKKDFFKGFNGISRFRQDQHKGIATFKLETSYLPDTFLPAEYVCQFIEGIYDGFFEIETWNVFPFYVLADYLQCSAITNDLKNYINSNMCNYSLVEAWAFSDCFQESCLNFVRTWQALNPIEAELFERLIMNSCLNFFGKRRRIVVGRIGVGTVLSTVLASCWHRVGTVLGVIECPPNQVLFSFFNEKIRNSTIFCQNSH